MTAQVIYVNGGPIPTSVLWPPTEREQGYVKRAPGTLWERVAESAEESAAKYRATLRTLLQTPEPRENIPQRVERIAYDHNISRREALHVALAESRLERAKTGRRYTLKEVAEEFGLTAELSLERGLQESARGEVVDLGDFTQYVDQAALERAKAAHPAGKGIKREEL